MSTAAHCTCISTGSSACFKIILLVLVSLLYPARLTRRTLPLARSDTSPNPGPKGGRVHESPVESASSSQSLGGLDLPEEFEVIKKKKDVIEEGLVK